MFKSKTVVIKARHDWGIDGTIARVSERFAALRANFIDLVGKADLTWDDNVGHIHVRALGQTVTATCEVEPKSLRITILLPWALAGLAGPIERFLDSHDDVLKAAPKPGVRPQMAPLPVHRRLLRLYGGPKRNSEEL